MILERERSEPLENSNNVISASGKS